jgi:hypothetical protein
MKPYIEFNTEQRRLATEKKELSKVAYFKNANNMVFGKNIENPEMYSNYIILKGEKAIEFYNTPENYSDFIEIDEDEPIILFQKKKTSINLNKPIIIGFCILDISKLIMAEHFFRLKDIFKDKLKLLYTDTDSFYLHIIYGVWRRDHTILGASSPLSIYFIHFLWYSLAFFLSLI